MNSLRAPLQCRALLCPCQSLNSFHCSLLLLLQPEELTPAQKAARRKNKKGSPLDGLMMVMSLVKRW